MNPRDIRILALEILDTEMGITTRAWATLEKILREYNMFDVIREVKAVDGYFYLPNDHQLSFDTES